MTELLALSEILKTPARQLSLGQRMRCEIAASLLHSPKLLFLDEPTIGLDAVSKIAVRNFILEINRSHQTTVILTTHDMQDIEALTSRILLIGKGRILLDGTLADMKKQFRGLRRVELDYTGVLQELPDGIRPVSIQSAQGAKGQSHAVLEVDTERIPVSQVIAYLSSHVELRDISAANVSIDETVARLYRAYQI